MTNLNKIKKQNGFNQKKDYNNAIISRSNKNKAMIAISSVAVGGGVFLGLLLPGLLPVVMAGAPVLAMSSNVVASAVAGSAVGGIHYAVNRQEGKIRKYSKDVTNSKRYKFDADFNPDKKEKNEKKSEKLENKSEAIYKYFKTKHDKLQTKLESLQNAKASQEQIEKVNKKLTKINNILNQLKDAETAASGKYDDDNKKLQELLLSIDKTDERFSPYEYYKQKLKNSESKTSKIFNKNKQFLLANPSKINIKNTYAFKKFKKVLNVNTTSLDDDAKEYTIPITLPDHTPIITASDIINASTLEDLKPKKKQDKKINEQKIVLESMEKYYNRCKQFENYLEEKKYHLPIIESSRGVSNLGLNDKPNLISYEFGDYQSYLLQPLLFANQIFELLDNGLQEDTEIIITSYTYSLNSGDKIEEGLSSTYKIFDKESALDKRNTIYLDVISNIYQIQKKAYEQGIYSKTSGLDIITKACELAIPKAKKSKEQIIDDLVSILGEEIKNDEFWKMQFTKPLKYEEEKEKLKTM